MKEMVSINGTLVLKEDARVSVFDRGFLYGDGVFETVRVYGGRPFMIDDHITRLLQGLKTLRFPRLPAGLKVRSLELIEANKVRDGILRIYVTRGELAGGIDPSACGDPMVVITAKEVVPYPTELYTKGMKAITSSIRKDHHSPLCRVKTANFLTHILARGEASDAGVEDAIMLNHDGFLSESTVSNIFFIKGGSLITPSEDCGILPGIARRIVLETVEKIGLHPEEKRIKLDELYSAEEAFLTNSLMEVMPLVEVDGRKIGNGLPGGYTGEIHKRYVLLASGKPA